MKHEIAERDRAAVGTGWIETSGGTVWALPAGRQMGKYGRTVTEWTFVVLFRHCLEVGKQAVWGCVGKVRASHFRSVVLSFWHPPATPFSPPILRSCKPVLA